MLKIALCPAVALARGGVAITAGVVCTMFALLPPPPSPYSAWVVALLIGAAPTDAAAVAMHLRRARLAFPKRVIVALEVESGLNDPVSVFLIVCLISKSWPRGSFMVTHAAILFSEERGGGALLLRWLPSAAHNNFAARWLAYMLPCRRFPDVPADACARLDADVGRYSFIGRVTVTVHTSDKLLSSDPPYIGALAKCRFRYK